MKLNPFNKSADKGKICEDIACEHLRAAGLKLINKNFSCRLGEIDLIMQDESSVVFVEVRYRKNQNYGGAKESITPKKQHKIKKTALYYMQTKGRELNARFDVIAMSGDPSNPTIEWIRNAF